MQPHPAQSRRRTPQSGKQRKAQLRAERQQRRRPEPDDDGDGEDAAAAAEAAQDAVVRAYHIDARGYRWRRSAADDDVLVGMVVQRARGGGVVVRLSLAPGISASAASAAAAADDPARVAVERLQKRVRALQAELSGLGRFKPSEVGGRRWASEAAQWAAIARRVAVCAAEAASEAQQVRASSCAMTEVFLLVQHALQAGGSRPDLR